MHFCHYLYFYIWRTLGLAPFVRSNAFFCISYPWVMYSFVLHSVLIFGLMRILLMKYHQGVSGKYVTSTQLSLRLAEQFFDIFVIATCVINKYVKRKGFLNLQKQLSSLEYHSHFPKKYNIVYAYPLLVTTIWIVFLITRLVLGCTSNNTWDTFLPQFFSSIIIIVCDNEWFIYLIHFNFILKHLNLFLECAINRNSMEMISGQMLTLKVVMKYYWKIHSIIEAINENFGVQTLVLIVYRAVRLIASCYALCLFTFQFELYPFSLDQYSLEMIWFVLRVNQLVILVFPGDIAMNELHRGLKLLRCYCQNLPSLYKSKEKQLLLTHTVISKSINFTSCNLFTIRLKLIMKIVGAITTYLVIAWDFQSTDIKRKKEHH